MRNRLALAPLTNQQSHADGSLSKTELYWLVERARGGFGMTMTCAAHVQKNGQGFPGQLGIFSDDQLPGLMLLANSIRDAGSISSVQLQHSGRRGDQALAGELVSASDDPETGSRGLREDEVEACITDFVTAARRAERAGFDGVELHGAHGYLLAQFLSAETNRRTDAYGGSVEKRARFVREVISRVRVVCGSDFQVGLRLSAERYGIRLGETVDLVQSLFDGGELDYIDLSLWDYAKEPEEEGSRGRSLLSYFTGLHRGATRLSCAGKINDGASIERALSEGADFVKIGRAAILHHDFPIRLGDKPSFEPVPVPVSHDYLRGEHVGEPFIAYLSTMGIAAREN
jgi:2,4-dienoyl-CoA reductase-like NADH-dependent reductase (Old Yellow Enzyme family)